MAARGACCIVVFAIMQGPFLRQCVRGYIANTEGAL